MKPKTRFTITSMLLLVTLVAVCLGWWIDRSNRKRKIPTSSIWTPSFHKEIYSGDPIHISGVLYTEYQSEAVSVVNLFRPVNGASVIYDSFGGRATRYAGQEGCFKFECTLENPTPYPPGDYTIRVTHHGPESKYVLCSSMPIRIVEKSNKTTSDGVKQDEQSE